MELFVFLVTALGLVCAVLLVLALVCR